MTVRGIVLLGAVVVAASVSAFGASAAPPRVESCATAAERAAAVRLRTADGVRLVGVVLGRGRVGVTLGHERGADLCGWLPFARILARRGYRVLAFDHRGHGLSQAPGYPKSIRLDRDDLAAVAELRRQGARRLVLMGASMGATAALVAAPAVGNDLAAVVDLSGPAEYVQLEAIPAVKRLAAPGLFAVGRNDAAFVADTKALRAASRNPGSRLVIRPTFNHGTALLVDPAFEQIVLDFVKRHAS